MGCLAGVDVDGGVNGAERLSWDRFSSARSDSTNMETDSWIERLLVNQLTTYDRRYKHDFAGVEKTSDDLIVASTQLDAITTEDGAAWPPLEDLLTLDSDLECEVEASLQTLEDRGLLERVGERERKGPPLEPGDYGTTTVWTPTLDGRAEASAIHVAYSDEVEALEEEHNAGSDEFRAKLSAIARDHGILPSLFD